MVLDKFSLVLTYAAFMSRFLSGEWGTHSFPRAFLLRVQPQVFAPNLLYKYLVKPKTKSAIKSANRHYGPVKKQSQMFNNVELMNFWMGKTDSLLKPPAATHTKISSKIKCIIFASFLPLNSCCIPLFFSPAILALCMTHGEHVSAEM